MAHRCLIINGKEPNAGVGGVSDADFSHTAVRFFTTGVIETGDYKVEAQATPDMTVKVKAGDAYVPNSGGTMHYPTELDTDTNVTISNNASGNPRIDAVIVKIDTVTAPNEHANNIVSLDVVEGTPAASPVAPTDGEIQTAIGASFAFYRLANVTVANGAASITSADVSDARALAALSSSAIADGAVTQTKAPTLLRGAASNERVERGTVTLSFSAGQVASNTVTFGTAFATAPTVVLSARTTSTNPVSRYVTQPHTPSTTGFSIEGYYIPGSTTDTVVLSWLAVGA